MKGIALIHELVLAGKLSPRAGAELLMLRRAIRGPYRRQRRRIPRATLVRGPLLARILRKLGALVGVS